MLNHQHQKKITETSEMQISERKVAHLSVHMNCIFKGFFKTCNIKHYYATKHALYEKKSWGLAREIAGCQEYLLLL
jgi:hypothetical protein